MKKQVFYSILTLFLISISMSCDATKEEKKPTAKKPTLM